MEQDLVGLKTRLQSRGIDVLRLIYADVLGITRSKDLLVSQLEHGAHNGPAFCQGVWVTTTRGGVLDANNIASDGLQDLVSRLDADTIRDIPWEPGVAYGIADAFNPDKSNNLMSPRTVLRSIIGEYAKLGLVPVVGPELEFYIADRTEGGYKRAIERTGMVYTTGAMVDPDGIFLNLLRQLDRLGIGVFAGNHEFSPSQYEINLWHSNALDAADRTFLFKTGIKDVVSRTGKVATFLGKPWSDEGGSGFHLHFSVTNADDINQMHNGNGELSEIAKHMIAGITKHAKALTAFCNPTINAFKRLGPDTLAPFRANWGYDNRSCMVRIPPERGQGTRLEVRVGDGAANPYLLIAAVLAAGLDGIQRKLECPEPAEGMAYDNEAAEILPLSFTEALDALEADTDLSRVMAQELINVFMVLKRDEIERYQAEEADPSTRQVTNWEWQEYMEDY